jgi:hypothetical protein
MAGAYKTRIRASAYSDNKGVIDVSRWRLHNTEHSESMDDGGLEFAKKNVKGLLRAAAKALDAISGKQT